jgi:hypothetical protein
MILSPPVIIMNFDIKHAKIVLLNSWQRKKTRTLREKCVRKKHFRNVRIVDERNENFSCKLTFIGRISHDLDCYNKFSSFESLPRPLLIESIMTRCFLFFLLIRTASISTLHVRIHLKHFKLLLYIRNFAHSDYNFATIFKHGVDCSIDKHRYRSICGLRLMRLIFCFLSISR